MSDDPQYPSEKQDRYIVRFPDGMRDELARLAKANKRSMNAEVVSRLQRSMADDTPLEPADPGVLGMLTEVHAMVSALHHAIKTPQPVEWTLKKRIKEER